MPDLRLTPDTAAKVGELVDRAAGEGMTLSIRSARRSCAEQNQLYALGRTAPGKIVTFARGCQSWHTQGRAVDVDIVKGPHNWDRLGAIGRELGFTWGGDFKGQAGGLDDVGHFEFHPGMTIASACPDPGACTDAVTGFAPPAPGSRAPFPWGRVVIGLGVAVVAAIVAERAVSA